jgi:hypothetical protein
MDGVIHYTLYIWTNFHMEIVRQGNRFYFVRTVHFGMKLCNDQRNAQVFNLFIYLRLSYMFRAFFKPIFRGRCTNSAVVQVCWVWCQRPGPTQPPVQWVPGLSREYSGRGVVRTTHPLLGPRSRMSRATPLLLLYAVGGLL